MITCYSGVVSYLGGGGGGGERESFPALMNFLALENQILFLYTLSILGLKEKIYW